MVVVILVFVVAITIINIDRSTVLMAHQSNHRRMNQPSIVVRGRVITGYELREYAERNGLCPMCGVYQTHKRTGNFLKPRFEPLTVTNAYNEITVYKGYCIAPTCFTLEKAKQLLGEIPVKRPSNAATSGQAIAEMNNARSVTNRTQYGLPEHIHDNSPNINSNGNSNVHRVTRQPSDSAMYPRNVERSEHSNNSLHPKPLPISDGSDHRRYLRTKQHSWGSTTGQQERPVSMHRRTPTGDGSTGGRLAQEAIPHDFFSNDSGHNRNSIHTVSTPSMPTLRNSTSNLQTTTAGTSPLDRSMPAWNHDMTDRMQRSTLPSYLTLSPLRVGSERTPSNNSIQDNEPIVAQDPLIRSLEEKIQESNYLEFINLLDHKERKTHVLLEGFRLFRFHVAREHMLKPDGVVLVGDNWVKVMKDKVQEFSDKGEREVVLSGLATFLTISRQGDTYKRALIRKDVTETVIKVWDEWPYDDAIMDCASSLVLSLLLHERISLNSKTFPRIAILIRKLCQIILLQDSCGKGLALRALFHISNQRKRDETTGKTALHDVRNALGNESCIQAILQVIQRVDMSPPIVEAGLVLLWKICLPKEEDQTQVLGATIENINSVLAILDKVKTPEVLEATCGILANFALSSIIPPDTAHRAVVRICSWLEDPELRTREVANVAVQVFCNLFANETSKPGIRSATPVMRTTIALLEEFPEEEEVVEYACLTLSYTAYESSETKEYLAGTKIFRLVRSAFDVFVTARGSQPSLPVKDATLCFFASIAGCEVGAHTLIESGLEKQLQTMLAMEMDADFQRILEVIFRNMTNIAGTNNVMSGSVLHQQPSLFLQLLRNAVSEEDVSALIRELGELGESGLAVLGNHGFDEMLTILSRYEYSSSVQKEGAYFLANLYYNIPFTGVEAPRQLPGGAWAVLHRKQAVDLLCDAIGSHPEDIETQISGLMALTNLLSPLCVLDRFSPNILQIQGWLTPVWKRVMQTLQATPSDYKLQESGLELCWVLVLISAGSELRNWMLSLLQQVFDTMNRFPSLQELNLIACEILLRLIDNQECTYFMGNSTCVTSLVKVLGEESTELVTCSSAILSALATRTMVAIDQIMQSEDILSCLISCISSNPLEPYIVTHICIILEAVMNFEDVSFRYEFIDNGGLNVLGSSIDAHQSSATMCRHVCLVVTLLVPFVNASILGSLRAAMNLTFVPLIDVHLNNPDTEAAVLDLIWAVCSMDDNFKRSLLTDQILQSIVQAMACHLESGDLQRSGCGMLWLLSGFGDGKRMIGKAGGIPAILNAMLAHNESTSIQKEGLSALKNLATEAFNKPLLAEYDCVRVVTYSLWINYQHPLVISSALSALNNIAVDSRTKSVAPLPPEVLDIVLSAMRRFPSDEILQKNACFYLKSCTYLPDNRVLMNQRAAELISVLQHASTSFPQSCSERVRSIMKKIERW